MDRSLPLPSAFESLAGICKFTVAERITPDFFWRHLTPVSQACAFIERLADADPALEAALHCALLESIADGAGLLEEAFRAITISPGELRWLDDQMTEVLNLLMPVVSDPFLPAWLGVTRWAIEGSFDGSTLPRKSSE